MTAQFRRLPLPVSEEAWMVSGDCRGANPDLWFPARGEATREAVAVCLACPVRLDCLDYAMRNREKHGIWGGVSERQRKRMRTHPPTAAMVRLKVSLGVDPSTVRYSARLAAARQRTAPTPTVVELPEREPVVSVVGPPCPSCGMRGGCWDGCGGAA